MSTAAGLFLGALATSAAAAADPVSTNPIPTNPAPALPGLVDQVVGASGSVPQQLLQTTNSTLAGTPVNRPPAGIPAIGSAPAAPGLPNLPGPGELSGMLEMLGSTPAMGVPGSAIPGLVAPTLPIGGPIPGLP